MHADEGQIVFVGWEPDDKGGSVPGTEGVYLLDIAPRMLTFDVAQTTVEEITGGSSVRRTVRRENSDNYTDLVVTLRSDRPDQFTVPPTVVIPAGKDQVTFDITVIDNNLLEAEENVHLFGTAEAFKFADCVVKVVDREGILLSARRSTPLQ